MAKQKCQHTNTPQDQESNTKWYTIETATNNEIMTTDQQPKNEQQPQPSGGLNAFYWRQIFTLDSGDCALPYLALKCMHTSISFTQSMCA